MRARSTQVTSAMRLGSAVLVALVLFAVGAPVVRAETPAAPALKESCDAQAAPKPRSPFEHWRCSGIVAASYADLERQVQVDHDVAKGWKVEDTLTLYVARSGHDSAWLFLRDAKAAIRWTNEYSANGTWSGMALTAFCGGTAQDCERAQGFVLTLPPPPGMGPPPPGEPPVVFDEPVVN
jgi:hypothetical protein